MVRHRVAQRRDDEVVGHEIAAVHVLGGAPPDLGAGRASRAQQLARGQPDVAELVPQALGLGALPAPRRPEQHDRRSGHAATIRAYDSLVDAAAEPQPDGLLDEANRALRAGEWSLARQRFDAVLAQEESPDALLGLANALWWLGETEASVRHLERSYVAFRRRPDPAHAVLAAVNLCLTYLASLGNHAAAARMDGARGPPRR